MDDNVKKIILVAALLVVAVVLFLILRPGAGPNYNTEIQKPKPMSELMQQRPQGPGGAPPGQPPAPVDE